MSSFKVEVHVQREWVQNNCRYATREEAKAFAVDIAQRWSAVYDTRVLADKLPPTHRFITRSVALEDIHEYVPDRFEVSGNNRPDCYTSPKCAKQTKDGTGKCNLPREDEVHRV